MGILGGTFDPIHNTHLDMARAASHAHHLDTVLFVVAARPPHKRDDTVASAQQRYEMVEAAVAEEAGFEACDLELRREGPSYTAETLRELEGLNPDADLFLIIGRDSLLDLPKWKDPDAIFDRAKLLVAPRESDDRAIPDVLTGRYEFFPFEESTVSSTEIRRRIASDEAVNDLVPFGVIELMARQGFYTPFPHPRAEEFLELLRERLPEKTYDHCVSVAKTMLACADEAQITAEQAVEAGLLHDLCKATKPSELAEAASQYGIREHLDNPNLLHGPVAAEECCRKLGIEDGDVLDAIQCHTTGRAGWSRVGLAIFLADFSEPLRTHEGSAEARDILARDGFIPALRFAISQKLEHVKKHHTVDSNSLAFAEWFESEFG